MNLWFYPKCKTEKTGPQWRNNSAGGVITVNPNDDPPICPDCEVEMKPTSEMGMAEEIEEDDNGEEVW